MGDEIGQRGGSKSIRDSVSVGRETVDRDTPELYEFGPFRLDPAERKLLRDNQIVALTPKAFDTLLLLVRNSGHLLGKDELIRMLGPTASLRRATSQITSSCCGRLWARMLPTLKQFPSEVTALCAPCDSCRLPRRRIWENRLSADAALRQAQAR